MKHIAAFVPICEVCGKHRSSHTRQETNICSVQRKKLHDKPDSKPTPTLFSEAHITSFIKSLGE